MAQARLQRPAREARGDAVKEFVRIIYGLGQVPVVHHIVEYEICPRCGRTEEHTLATHSLAEAEGCGFCARNGMTP